MRASILRRVARRVGAAAIASALLTSCAPGAPATLALEDKFSKWTRYEGEPGASHFSSLDQINKSNVSQLQVAWTSTNGGTNFNPIIIDTMLYAVGRNNTLIALHAATGREIWSHTPATPGAIARRSLMYWENDDRTDRRIYLTRENFLYAVDATTGRPIENFGTNGRSDLRQGITSRDHKAINATPSSPGVVFEDILIFGSGPGEAYSAGPGDIRAFDARTGQFLWVFHTIPHPGEYGYETWPADAWQRVGGTNAWGGMSVDDKRGIVYVPLGSASYDFYGADRVGDNLFANSLVALDARTGKRLWHFQTIHHDLWDYDLTATPTLLTIRKDGRAIDIVALATKHGFLFVFDRVTGEPIWPIEERPVPASDMPGEVASPTQPYPTWPKPFAIQSFTEADLNPHIADPAERDSIARVVRESLNLGLFTPPSTRPTMQMPGNRGGANWGRTAADPRNGSFYVVTENLPTMLKLERILPGVFGTGTSQADRGQFAYQQNCQACHMPTLTGQPPMIPTLVGVTDRLSAEEIATIIRSGKGNMPGFVDLSNQEINSIITYLRAPGAASPPQLSSAQAASEGDAGPMRFQSGYGYMRGASGLLAIKPPWTTMTKYDLNSGEILWQVPVGEIQQLTARGITGTGAGSLNGGPAVTAGGLLFLITDNKLRAYDADTGAELWAGQLPANGSGIPAVYEVGGRQYVVVGTASGGGGGGGGQQGGPPPVQAYVAFALPR